MQNIFHLLVIIGSIALCLGLALIGLQFLCVIVSFVAVAIWGAIGSIVRFLTTKN